MERVHSLPPFAAVVVAAGQGLRAGQPLPKQFARWRGKPVLRHSVEALLEAGAAPLIVVIPENAADLARAALNGLEGYRLVDGGGTRQQSVLNGLEAVGTTDRILIHDAARPVLPLAVIERVLAALDRSDGAIPVLPVVDSLSRDEDGMMVDSPQREELRRVQTPQGFRFSRILSAHRAWQGAAGAGDDAQVLRAAGGSVAHVLGDERLSKLTFAEDFMTELPAVRIGMGFDVHRLVNGEELWLGGIQLDYHKGLAGHSDADVALHAVVDALLGAIGLGDIGTHFPPSDAQWKGTSSDKFVIHALGLVQEAGYEIGNLDLTIICEEPKIGPYRDAIRARIAELLGADSALVSVKATTTERLGFTGRGEGIAAQCIATLIRN